MEENQAENIDIHIVGEHFLSFSVGFFNQIRGQFQQQNCIRAGTQAFHALVVLHELEAPPPTMSCLAARLGITKQQLTKLVNDLEGKGLVRREHDQKNRRQVCLTITPEGTQSLSQLKKEMLDCTVSALSVYTDQELSELDQSIRSLVQLLPRFYPKPEPENDI